jgi:hypothetical protein
MNGECRRKSLFDARSAQWGLALGGSGGLIAGAAASSITGSLILGGAWNGAVLIGGFIIGY